MASRPASKQQPVLLILLVIALAALLACGKNDMAHQARVDPGERAALPAAGSVPVDGLEPPTLEAEVIEGLRNPVPPTAASVRRGRRLFAAYCAPCHGPDGRGDGILLEELGELADLAELTGPDVTDGYLYSILRHGGVSMPGYGTELEAEERWDLVNFLRSLADR